MIHYLKTIFGTVDGVSASVSSDVLGYYITTYESQIFLSYEDAVVLKFRTRIPEYCGAYWKHIGEENVTGIYPTL